jgi:predicted NACHT family NTPase
MAQHGLLVERAKGIFSFSHLTFHEYFAAKRIVDTQRDRVFQQLSGHAGDKRWQEVFFLVLGMLPDASYCLLTIKQEIDGILAGDDRLQEYLLWLDEKCRSINEPFHLLYLDLDLYLYFSLSIYFSWSHYLDKAIDKSKELGCNVDFIAILQNLRQQVPDQSDFTARQEWREQHLTDWRKQLRAAIIQYRNIGHDWKFTELQRDNLKKYYFAYRLLHDCLEAIDECYLALPVRQYITDTFCRPLHLIPPPPVI